MAIAFGAAAGNFATSGTTTSTTSITVSGTNTYGIAYAQTDGGIITGVTWNGVGMTQVTSLAAPSGSDTIYMFAIANPGTGAVTATRNTSVNQLAVVASCYSGVSQTGNPEAHATNSSTATTSLSTSVTTITNNAWTVGVALALGGTVTGGTGTTIRANARANSYIFDSNAPITPAGSSSLTIAQGSGEVVMIVASLKPIAVPANGNFLTFM